MTKLPLIAAALAAAGLANTASFAQTDAEAVERCRALATDAERFACLEDYVLGEAVTADRAAPLAPPVTAPRADPEAPPAAAPIAPTVAAAPTPPAAASEPPSERRGLLSRLPLLGDRGGEERAAVDAGEHRVEADALGDEQVAGRRGERPAREEDARYAFTIAHVDESFFGGLQVELENGQVWRQQRDDGQRVFLREGDPMAVEIWRSSQFGGYRMRLVEQRRTIRVERLR